jgi:hypothetical protein
MIPLRINGGKSIERFNPIRLTRRIGDPMTDKVQRLKGANMDIDLASHQGSIGWQ